MGWRKMGLGLDKDATDFLNTVSYTCVQGGDWMLLSENKTILVYFAADFLLLLASGSLVNCLANSRRCILAAALAGTYAAVGQMPGFPFLAGSVWRIIALSAIALIAYGISMDALQQGIVFLILHLSLEALISETSVSGLLAVAALVIVFLRAGRRRGMQTVVPVSIHHGDRQIALSALMDTGNTLKDPVTGWPVLVVDPAAAEELLGFTGQQLSQPLQTMLSAAVPGLRLIPYHSVGQSAGLLLGIKADYVEVNGKVREMVVAFAPDPIGRGSGFRALTGGVA